MRTVNSTMLDLSKLPEQARQELTDFYQFLEKKYRSSKTRRKTGANTSAPVLSDTGFAGMWKDRVEMNDAAGWVREQRESAWSRHE